MDGVDTLTPEQRDALEKDKRETPICPHCAADPILIGAKGPSVIGKVKVMTFFCGNCRKVLTVQAIEVAHAASRIHLAGRA